MSFGFGVLRLDPVSFWAMTPRELASAYQGMTGGHRPASLSRADFHNLMTAFPDAISER